VIAVIGNSAPTRLARAQQNSASGNSDVQRLQICLQSPKSDDDREPVRWAL